MHVVPARVHHMHIFAFIIFGDGLAGVRQTSFFFHWQRVHVGADKHGRPVAILHHADDAVTFEVGVFVFAEMFGDLATGRAQFLRDDRRGAFLVPG